MYDHNNIFAKIIRGEAPCKKVYENNYALAFNDAFPKTKIHVLVVPKGYYKDLSDFLNNATAEEKVGYFDALEATLKILNLKNGYRIVSNTGEDGCQEVPHLHFHIVGGQKLGSIILSKNKAI